ncbi:MAG TPA: hypothetical protein VM347_31265 [Nonomuraea sp.]|nr:hypothetical protein [Nonomuraea sp.]
MLMQQSLRHGGGGDGLLALLLNGLKRAGGVGEFSAQPIGLTGGVDSGLGSGLAGLLGHGRRSDRLLSPLLFGSQRRTESVNFFGARCRGATGLLALLLNLADPGLQLLQPTTKVGELALPVVGLLFQFGDAGGRCGVQLGELGGSLVGGVTVVLGLALPVGCIGGELLGLGSYVLVLADLSPGVLLALLGMVACDLGLLSNLFGGGDPGGGGVGRGDGALLGGRRGRAGLLRCLFGGLDLGERAGTQLGQLGAQRLLSDLPLLAGRQQGPQEILGTQQRVGHRSSVHDGTRPKGRRPAGVAAVLGAAAAPGQGPGAAGPCASRLLFLSIRPILDRLTGLGRDARRHSLLIICHRSQTSVCIVRTQRFRSFANGHVLKPDP